MSPFISASRRVRRRPPTPVLAVALCTSLLFASFTLPAFAGQSALQVALKALRVAKKADKPVGTSRLVNGAVTTIKLSNGAVTDAKIAAGAVRTTDLADHSVGTAKIIDGSVETQNIADGAVTQGKLAAGAVGSAQIANGSVSLEDITGTDVTGTIDIPSIAANSCLNQLGSVPGAVVGQFPMIAFEGSTPLPGGITVQAIKVSAADTVLLRLCNVTNSASTASSGVGDRIITLD